MPRVALHSLYVPALVQLLWMTDARAQSEQSEAETRGALSLSVTYEAPPECPTGSAFLAALQAQLSNGGQSDVSAHVRLRRATSGRGFELVSRLHSGGAALESVTRGESCEALMLLAALNAGMARADSGRAASLLSPSDLGPGAPVTTNAPAGECAASSLAPGVVHDAGANPEAASGEADAWMPSALVLSEVRVNGALLPRPTWGAGVALGLAFAPWSVRLASTWWREQRGSFGRNGSSPVSLVFEEQSFELAPCIEQGLSRRFAVGGCAVFSGHHVDTDSDRPLVVPSLGAAALGSVLLWRGLRLEARVGLEVTIGDPRFGADSLPLLYQPPGYRPSAQLALGWSFGDDEAGRARAEIPSALAGGGS